MKHLLYRWVSMPAYTAPPRWMAFTFYCYRRDKCLYSAFPLNLLICAAWWLQDRWARAANAPSWIEREVESRVLERARFITKYKP